MKNLKTTRPLRLLALALCLVLALAGCSNSLFDFGTSPNSGSDGATGTEPSAPRRTIPYSQMTYARPDLAAIKGEMAELTHGITNAPDFETLMTLDDRAGELYEQFNTMHTLAMIKRYHDATDTYYDEEYRYLEDEAVELTTLMNTLNRAIVDGPFAKDYENEVGSYVYQSILDGLLLDSDAVQPYKKERASLNADYNQMLSTLSITHEGAEYTLEDLPTVESYALYLQLNDALFAGNAAEFTEMYARMVELDKQTAHTLGFESAIDMYYLSYDRDYTKEDAQRLFDNVKTYLVPLVPLLYADYFDPGPMDQQAAFAQMPEAMAAVSEELPEAWDYMLEYGLYDTDPLPNKQSGIGFTTPISGYDAPFIYMSWDEGFGSLTTLTHEFGHFYDFWLHYDADVVFNLDIAETYSQGLELLMHQQYGLFTTDDYAAELARLSNLQNIATGALIYQCVLEDFQMRAYALDTFDATILGRLFHQVLSEYGMGAFSFTDVNGADHSWFSVTHLFDSPFYTISYVTSATAAMQIWAQSQDDWQAAADTYLQLIHADQNQSFTDLLTSAGLRPPHDPAVLREIADALQGTFQEAFAAAG